MPKASQRIDVVPIEKLFRAYLVIFVLAVLAAGCAAAVAILVSRGDGSPVEQAMTEPQVRQEAVDELVRRARGVWDSFPDPDVGRILQPRLKARKTRKNSVDSNRFGLRERDFAVPKPDGLRRIVLLGDSYVFGAGVEMEERVGIHLERMFQARSQTEVEVLHVGMGSWNIRAETSYLQRNLGNFEPDLVVHVLVSNDLDDSGTVRGFGGVANFSSQRPWQTTTIRGAWPINGLDLGFRKGNHINHALGFESVRRFEEAANDLERLSSRLERAGVPYLVVLSWGDEPQIAAPRLLGGLPEERFTFLPESHWRNLRYRLGPSDPHWNPAGHERVARLIYGVMEERELWPGVERQAWPEAVELFRTLHREGLAEAFPERPRDPDELAGSLRRRVEMASLDESTARQIYGGIQSDGLVAPYAAVLLRRGEGTHLRLVGEATNRSELADVKVAIFADEVSLGTVELPERGTVDLTLPLPAEVLARTSFDVRLVADDFAYFGEDLRLCGVFRLRQLAVITPSEP